MGVQVSTANNIITIDGNGFALYKDANTNQLMVKDSNGRTELLSELLGGLSGDQDNIARIITVNNSNLSGEGTIKEQIAEYINSLDYEKLATDAEIWVEYDDADLLTEFAVSTLTGDACLEPDLSPYNAVLYHNGEGAFPVIGDEVYEDAEGTLPFFSPLITSVQASDGTYIVTEESGLMVEYTCR